MLLLFVIILLVVGLAIIGALYSLFLPFFQQLGDIKQYNMAYYGAVSSLERGMLALRYHGPGFEGESGKKNGILTGSSSDMLDGLSSLDGSDDVYWSLRSRTQLIPSPSQGNVPYALVTGDSLDYVVFGYNDLMEYQLDVDTTNNASAYYMDGYNTERSNLDIVSLFARLPQSLYVLYGANLSAQLADGNCPSTSDCDWDDDRVDNDLAIDRSLEGNHDDQFFRIVPRVDVNYVSGAVENFDTLIRESYINTTTNDSSKVTAAWGGGYLRTPLSNNPTPSLHPATQNIIGPQSVVDGLGGASFLNILDDSNVTDLKLLLGLARIITLSNGKMYPFLEVKIKAGAPIPDLYYHLHGHAKVGDYDVTLRIKKPTSDRSLLGSFTVVF